jgi:hypothetical protein
MMDFQMGEVLDLMKKTTPFLIFRFLIYFGITLAYTITTGVGAGVGYLIGRIGADPQSFSFYGGLAGFGLVSVVLYYVREYLLYLVKAGHIAVLVEFMDGKELPGGKRQIDYANQMVRERFAESSVLFGVDQLIKGVLKAFNSMFFTITNFLPIPGLQGLAKFISTVINLSLTYLDEVILAHNFRTRAENPWKSGQTALILYAQNYQSFLKNTFFMAFFIWGLTFMVFLIILGPVAGLVSLFPGTAGPLTLIIALVFAWGVKQAVIEPIGMTALMQVFFKVTEGQEANPEWEAKLDIASKKFGEIKAKALDWGMGKKPVEQPTLNT